eukprot:CAMPEP_0178628492 /NCGR_PEP_ID=MMETSP0698-20121128/9453_1 /TAXON_ID=265572 /ORGANISM="Extubocellulus spinifer, Strain CCMP396" /LENGTH=281 /DNA_ID=CAMNT_0020267751 /DNA_START=362 /DNA_END=1207 /DNA_ORIENTATION=-
MVSGSTNTEGDAASTSASASRKMLRGVVRKLSENLKSEFNNSCATTAAMSLSECSSMPCPVSPAAASKGGTCMDIISTLLAEGSTSEIEDVTVHLPPTDSRNTIRKKEENKNVIGLEIMVASGQETTRARPRSVSSRDVCKIDDEAETRRMSNKDLHTQILAPPASQFLDKVVRTPIHRRGTKKDSAIPSLQVEAILNESKLFSDLILSDDDNDQPSDDDSATSTRFGTVHRPWPKMMGSTPSADGQQEGRASNHQQRRQSKVKFLVNQVYESLAAETQQM